METFAIKIEIFRNIFFALTNPPTKPFLTWSNVDWVRRIPYEKYQDIKIEITSARRKKGKRSVERSDWTKRSPISQTNKTIRRSGSVLANNRISFFFLFFFFHFLVRRRKNLRERDRPVRFVATRRLGKVNGNVIFIRLVPRSILLATVLTPRKT